MQLDPIHCRIERINGQIKTAELYALLWLARVTTGETKKRAVYHGNKTPFSDDEKVADALGIIQTHIRNITELTETKIELMKALENERHSTSNTH